MSDERKGKPSASSMERYAQCPASWKLGQKAGEEVATPEQIAWRESGQRIHSWLEAPDFVELNDPKEMDIAKRCQAQALELFRVWQSGKVSVEVHVATVKERRLWLKRGRKEVLSGQADLVGIILSHKSAIILDYKTSYGETVVSSENLQLRTLAVLLDKSEAGPLDDCTVAIVQPLTGEPLVCRYDRKALDAAHAEVLEILDAIEAAKEEDTKPGPHCKYCPARVGCKSAIAVLEELGLVNKKQLPVENAEEMNRLLLLCETAKPIIKAIEAKAKEMLKANPDAIPGWRIGKVSCTREITDANGAYEALYNADAIDNEVFMRDCIGVGLGDLKAAVAKFKDISPAKADELINETCAEFIKTGTKEGSLEKV